MDSTKCLSYIKLALWTKCSLPFAYAKGLSRLKRKDKRGNKGVIYKRTYVHAYTPPNVIQIEKIKDKSGRVGRKTMRHTQDEAYM